MAANDLMMRIQLLVESGKSSAELKRLQQSLAKLRSQLSTLENVRLPKLLDSLQGVKRATDTLKTTNLSNFSRSLDKVSRSFAGLGLGRKTISDLRTAYSELNKQLQSPALANYRIELDRVNQRLKEAKALTLTGDSQTRNSTFEKLNRDLRQYDSLIRAANLSFVQQRRTIQGLKQELSALPKYKFDNSIVELLKLNPSRNLKNQPLVKGVDQITIDSIKDYNDSLLKQQQGLLKSQNATRQYSAELAKLRAEAQKAKAIDLSNIKIDGKNRDLLKEFKDQQQAIRKIRTEELIPLQNEYRRFAANRQMEKAKFAEPLSASLKVARAELALFNREAVKLRSIEPALRTDAQDQRLKDLQDKINKYNDSILQGNLRLAQLNQSSVKSYSELLASGKKIEANIKNRLATATNELKTVRELVSEQKQLAQQAANQVRVRQGGINDVQKQVADQRQLSAFYKNNIGTLKQFVSERKEAARVDLEAKKAEIVGLQQRLAQGQLTKAQWQAERAQVKASIQQEQERARVYRETLRSQVDGIRQAIKSETEREASLRKQVGELTKLATVEARRKQSSIEGTIGGIQQNQRALAQQAKELEAAARSSLRYSEALERLQQSGNRFGQRNAINEMLRESQSRFNHVNQQIQSFNQAITDARTRLNAMGSGNKTLGDINQSIKNGLKTLREYRSEAAKNPMFPASEIQALQQRVTGLRQTQQLLRQIENSQAKVASLRMDSSALQGAIAQLQEMKSLSGKFGQFMQGMGSMFTPQHLGIMAMQSALQSLTNALQTFISVNAQMETTVRGMDAVFGIGQGDVQLGKLIGIANQYGLALGDLTKNYLNLNASAKGTQLEGAEIERGFRSLSAAMAVLGADTITTNRAFRAVGQMISKGQVYAEELKGQLAEALPGAVQLFAKSMGKSTQEFLAMVKAGQVGVNELIPFFREIESTYSRAALASTTYEQATNRLSNAWSLLMKGIGDTGAWQKLVGFLDATGRALNIVASLIQKDLVDRIAELNQKKIKPIIEIDRAEFDKLRSIVIGDKEYKLTTIGSFENYEEYIAKINAANKANQQYNETLEEQALVKQREVDRRSIGEMEEEIRKIESLRNRIMNQEDFNKKFYNMTGVPMLPSALINAYEQYLSKQQESIKNEEAKLPALRELLDILKASTSEQEQQEKSSSEQVKLTKQQIKELTNLLNTEQQAYMALNAVEQKRMSLDLRRLQALSGADKDKMSKFVIEEAKSTLGLLNTINALTRARTIEGIIIRDNADASKNTLPDQIKQVKELTADQLKHALSLARSSNNYSAILGIMSELRRVQRDIYRSESDTNPLSGLAKASEDVRKSIEATRKAMDQSAESTKRTTGEMYSLLSLTEQRERLLRLKTSQKESRELTEVRAEWDYQKALLNSGKAVSEKKKQQLSLKISQDALNRSQEVFNRLLKEQDPSEMERLREVFSELMGAFDGEIGSAGNDYWSRSLMDQAKDLRKAFSDLTFNVNGAAIDQELKKIEAQIERFNRYVDSNGRIDFKVGFDDLDQELHRLQGEYLKTAELAKSATGEDRTAYQRQLKQIVEEIALLNQTKEELKKQYQERVLTGDAAPIEFNVVLNEEVRTVLDQLGNDLVEQALKQKLLFPTDVDNSKIEQQVTQVHGQAQAKANQLMIQFPIGNLMGDTKQALADLNRVRNQLIQLGVQINDIQVDGNQLRLKVNLDQAKQEAQSFIEQINRETPTIKIDIPTQPINEAVSSVTRLKDSYVATVSATLGLIPASNAATTSVGNLKTLYGDFAETLNHIRNNPLKQQQTNQSFVQIEQSVSNTNNSLHDLLSSLPKVDQKIKQVVATQQEINQPVTPTINTQPMVQQAQQASQQVKQKFSETIKALTLTSDAPQIQGEIVIDRAKARQEIQAALQQQGVDYQVETIPVVDQEGIRREVQRATATGQFKLPIPGFQVQANTWDEIVSEGNRYMKTRELVMQGKLDPNSINDVVVNAKIEPQQLYQETQRAFEQPIVVDANAQQAVGEIQSELAALQQSGATNIKVRLDNETGKLIIEADTDPANQAVKDIINRIESKEAVLRVKVKYDTSGAPKGLSNVSGFASGGLIPGGYSRRDSYLAMLSPGEFVIPSHIVKKFGPDYFYDFIKNRRPSLKENISVPRFSNGGMMPSAGQPIVINLPGNKPIHLSGSRDAAAQLVKVLTQTGRAL